MLIELKNAIKSKILFQTEDGVDIYEGNSIYCLYNSLTDLPKVEIANNEYNYNFVTECKYFSTKEAAEEYILMNKHCLSISDILKLQNRWSVKTIDKLKELVKNK